MVLSIEWRKFSMIPRYDLYEICDELGDLVYKFAGKKILLTGGAGFLGQAFLDVFKFINEEYLEPGKSCRIISVDNYIAGNQLDEEIKKDIFIFPVHADITNQFDFGHCDYIINAAGIAAPSVYMKYPEETLLVSLLGTQNCLKLAQKYGCESSLFFSSSEVYATPPAEYIPTPETFIGTIPSMSPRSCYDLGKQVLENFCYIYNQKNVHSVIVRPFNVYSYVKEIDTRVLPNFIKSVMRNETLKVYGKTSNTRTFCFLNDAIIGFIKALLLGKSGEVYNIGNDKPETTMYELAALVKKVSNSKSNIEVIPYPENYPSTEPLRRCPDISKARKELLYEPKVSLETGIKKFYDWAVQNYSKSTCKL